MAKSIRASVSKRNKAKLRATVFGPVVDARTERLSAKLLELAAQPKPHAEASNMDSEDSATAGQEGNTTLSESNEDMDIDKGTATQSHSRKSGRIHKRHSNRKNRSSIVFKPRQSNSKKGSKRR